MDINFICSAVLMITMLCVLFALFMLQYSNPRSESEGLAGMGVSPQDTCLHIEVSKAVEDGDVLLGNSLSCLLIQIGVAKKFSKKSPEVAFNALEEAETLAQQSLWQLRLKRQEAKPVESEMPNTSSRKGLTKAAL